MRFLATGLAALCFVGCSPISSPVRARTLPAPQTQAPIAVAKPVIVSTPVEEARIAVREISGITFEGVAFDSRNHHLKVVDQIGGPGSQYADASAAGRSLGGIAAVNAGFFTPEGAPLGMMATGGAVFGS